MKGNSGQTALPMVLLISLVLIELVVANVFISGLVVETLKGKRVQTELEKMAYTGIQDAFIKITRNKNLGLIPFTNVLNLNDFEVRVEVSQDSLNNLYFITSTAASLIFNYKKRLVGILSVDKVTGQVKLVSIKEKAAE